MKGLKRFSVISLMLSSSVFANCELKIEANDMMQFSTSTLSAPKSCESVTVTLVHTGKLAAKTMGHNWVLTRTQDFKGVAMDGMQAGLENQYVKPGDNRVLAFTKVIGGGESASITFSTKSINSNEEYTFFCSFPGHFGIMKGKFKLI